MKVDVYGSCRVFEAMKILENIGLVQLINIQGDFYTHTISEVIQKNKIIKKELLLEYDDFKYLIADSKNARKIYDDLVSKTSASLICNSSEFIVIEISSLKENIIDNNIYSQLGLYDLYKRNILNRSQYLKFCNVEEYTLNENEFNLKLIELEKLFKGKKIILVGYIQPEDIVIKNRELINIYLDEFSKNKENFFFLNPNSFINSFKYDEIMLNSTHYNNSFFPEVAKKLSEILFFDDYEIIKSLINYSFYDKKAESYLLENITEEYFNIFYKLRLQYEFK